LLVLLSSKHVDGTDTIMTRDGLFNLIHITCLCSVPYYPYFSHLFLLAMLPTLCSFVPS
jgi:hypothetical protein